MRRPLESAVGQDVTLEDRGIRQRILERIRSVPSGMPWLVDATVRDGVVDLWGPVTSEEEYRAILAAVETTPGVRQVRDNLAR